VVRKNLMVQMMMVMMMMMIMLSSLIHVDLIFIFSCNLMVEDVFIMASIVYSTIYSSIFGFRILHTNINQINIHLGIYLVLCLEATYYVAVSFGAKDFP